ncbi:hypothetical protein D1007_07531 [Hordeum vulgare]|nr:hypothetical protein D1007_07531 [Hordeum vulgare]
MARRLAGSRTSAGASPLAAAAAGGCYGDRYSEHDEGMTGGGSAWRGQSSAQVDPWLRRQKRTARLRPWVETAFFPTFPAENASDLSELEEEEADEEDEGGVVLNLGVPLEFHASKVYTSSMYELFQHAIYLSGSFVLQEAWESEQGMVYVVNHIYAERRQAWSRTQYHVLFDEGSGGYLCECGLYSHMGNVVLIMLSGFLLSLGVREIPEDATYRHSSMYNKALEIVQMGDKNTEAYGAAMKVLLDGISTLNDTNQESDGQGLHDQTAAQVHDQDMPVTQEHMDCQDQ